MPRCLRLTMAVLFALLTLLQVPAMVFARGAAFPSLHATVTSSHVDHVAHGHSHSQSPDIADGQDLPGDTRGAPLCHSVACCTGLATFGIDTPATIYLLLGLLDVIPAAGLVPTSPDPADPPPRLQT